MGKIRVTGSEVEGHLVFAEAQHLDHVSHFFPEEGVIHSGDEFLQLIQAHVPVNHQVPPLVPERYVLAHEVGDEGLGEGGQFAKLQLHREVERQEVPLAAEEGVVEPL